MVRRGPWESRPICSIERYGLIGDCGTAALVSDEGSIDWLCLPGFDADPVFGRLLDPGGGHCAVRAARLRETHRRYLPGTPALETTFRTETGVATLTDLFASVPAARKEAELWPFRWLIRRVQGVEGRVGLDVEVAPRDPFGGGRWDLRPHGRALAARRGGRAILAACSAAFAIERDTASARIEIGRTPCLDTQSRACLSSVDGTDRTYPRTEGGAG